MRKITTRAEKRKGKRVRKIGRLDPMSRSSMGSSDGRMQALRQPYQGDSDNESAYSENEEEVRQ